MWWARRNRVPVLVWIESTAKDQRHGQVLVESLKGIFLLHCQGAVVPGKSSFEYAKSLGIPQKCIFTAPNAVDIDLFASEAAAVHKDPATYRQKLQLPSRFFLFAGRLVPEKGVFNLLAAYGKLPEEFRNEVDLVFAGEGVSRAELMRRASAINPGSVHFAGFVHREQLAVYYGLAEVFVFPTHTDPWGLVVNEAMACGLPIIVSSAAGCAADLVVDHWNGLVVRPADSNQLASAMAELVRDTKLRFLLAQRSSEKILQYSPEACAAGIATAVLSCGDETND
jgi:glycosyltransferase involved in cell wall biosynthesis